MAEKENKVEVKKEKKAIVKKDENKNKAVWLGSQVLMGKFPPGSKEANDQKLVLMTARVLDVSPFGINILGSVPYINKLGLTQKANQYGKGKETFEYKWVKIAMDDAEKAICECRVLKDGKPITDWVMGECSPKTMKMGTLTGYQNHMAQTRARNRAILEAHGVQIHEDMMANIHKLYHGGSLQEEQAAALSQFAGKTTSSSVEEINIEKKEETKADKEIEKIGREIFGGPEPRSASVPEEKGYKCSKTGAKISKQEYDFSMKMYGKPLSRAAQVGAKRLPR